MQWNTLVLSYDRGGLNTPDLELYYRAVQRVPALYWLDDKHMIPHVHIEKDAASPNALPRILFGNPARCHGVLDSLNVTAYAWKRILDYYAGSLLYSPYMKVEWCTWLKISQEKGVVKVLQTLGITEIGDLFENGVMRELNSFQEVAARTKPIT